MCCDSGLHAADDERRIMRSPSRKADLHTARRQLRALLFMLSAPRTGSTFGRGKRAQPPHGSAGGEGAMNNGLASYAVAAYQRRRRRRRRATAAKLPLVASASVAVASTRQRWSSPARMWEVECSWVTAWHMLRRSFVRVLSSRRPHVSDLGLAQKGEGERTQMASACAEGALSLYERSLQTSSNSNLILEWTRTLMIEERGMRRTVPTASDGSSGAPAMKGTRGRDGVRPGQEDATRTRRGRD